MDTDEAVQVPDGAQPSTEHSAGVPPTSQSGLKRKRQEENDEAVGGGKREREEGDKSYRRGPHGINRTGERKEEGDGRARRQPHGHQEEV
jgi:hypothetical protein